MVPGESALRVWCLAVAVLGGKLYAVGGLDEKGGTLNTVEVFDGDRWQSAPSMATKRSRLAAAVF